MKMKLQDKIKDLNLSEKLKSFLKTADGHYSLKKCLTTFGLTGALIAGSGTAIYSNFHIKSSNGEEIGYTDIHPFFETEVDADDFVLLNVGNYDDLIIKKEIIKAKISYCNEHNIAVGIVINATFENDGAIYKEIVYLKKLMTDYKIDLPVYINIDKIVENGNLNNIQKKDLINSFLNKNESNSIYAGICGSESNLLFVKNSLEIEAADSLILNNDGNISYDGNYSYYKLGNRFYLRDIKSNPKDVISTNYYNNSKNFLLDGEYTYHTGDNLNEIANKYGLSVKDILEYNNIQYINILGKIIAPNLNDGYNLSIPNINSMSFNESNGISYKYVEDSTNNPIKGADISSYNNTGKDIDWEKVADQFDFLIIKAGEGTDIDKNFETFSKNACENNIPIGLYFVNTANSTMEKKDIETIATSQAELAIKQAKTTDVSYPIYLDLEADQVSDYLTEDDLNTILKIWYKKILAAGYVPGIYTSGRVADKIKNSIPDLYNDFSLWYAYGEKYDVDIPVEEVDIEPGQGTYAWENTSVDMQQVSSHATGSAISTNSGYVDVNFSKVDFSEKYSISDSKINTDQPHLSDFIATSIGIGCLLGIRCKRKNKVKTKSI